MGSDDKKIDISTDDANINGSAEALQQYLLKQIESNKPILRLQIDGSETSNATGITTEQQNFLFLIDIPLPSSIAPHPIHYSLADSEPAYRGRSTREWTNPNGGTGNKREYTGLSADNTYIKQRDARRARGYPPWLVDLPSSAPASTAFNASLPPAGASGEEVNEYVNQQTAIERTAWKSSQSLAQWAEEYVAATRSKEFIFLQETYGWDMEKLRSLIKEAIKEQGQYSSAGSVDISTSHLNGKIQVRPASTMGKLVSAFGGAGTWKVCGVAYPLVGYVEARFDDQGTVKTMSGLKKRVGMTEEEWFARHKSTILDAVKKGLDSSKPLVLPLE